MGTKEDFALIPKGGSPVKRNLLLFIAFSFLTMMVTTIIIAFAHGDADMAYIPIGVALAISTFTTIMFIKAVYEDILDDFVNKVCVGLQGISVFLLAASLLAIVYRDPPPGPVAIGGVVQSLSQPITLLLNGKHPLVVKPVAGSDMISQGWAFPVHVKKGSKYTITIKDDDSFTTAALPSPSSLSRVMTTQRVAADPPANACSIANGSGTANGFVFDVAVNCGTVGFTVGGNVSGYNGEGLVLTLTYGVSGQETMNVPKGETSFLFKSIIDNGITYEVKPTTQPTKPAAKCKPVCSKCAVGSSRSVLIACDNA